MYYVYKVMRLNFSAYLALVGTFTDETLAKQKAVQLKGLVKRNGQIWFDCRV
jgi:hypothetical protein